MKCHGGWLDSKAMDKVIRDLEVSVTLSDIRRGCGREREALRQLRARRTKKVAPRECRRPQPAVEPPAIAKLAVSVDAPARKSPPVVLERLDSVEALEAITSQRLAPFVRRTSSSEVGTQTGNVAVGVASDVKITPTSDAECAVVRVEIRRERAREHKPAKKRRPRSFRPKRLGDCILDPAARDCYIMRDRCSAGPVLVAAGRRPPPITRPQSAPPANHKAPSLRQPDATAASASTPALLSSRRDRLESVPHDQHAATFEDLSEPFWDRRCDDGSVDAGPAPVAALAPLQRH